MLTSETPRDATHGAERVARDAAGYSIPPLFLLAIVFFVPSIRDCGEMVSPLDLARLHVENWAAILPTFVTAATLAGVTGWCRWRIASPAPRLANLSLVFVWLCAFGYAPALFDAGAIVLPVFIVVTLILVALSAWVTSATRWTRWGRVLVSYLLVQIPIGVVMLLFAAAGGRDAGPGAYVYSLAIVGLVLIWIAATVRWRAKNRVDAPPVVRPNVYR